MTALVFGSCHDKDQKTKPIEFKDLFKTLQINKIAHRPAENFTLKNLDDEYVSLGQYSGKVVFLNFWASWYPPCREEILSMQNLWNKFHKKGLAILAINLKEDIEAVRSFVKQNSHTFPVLLDTSGDIAQSYNVRALPTTFIISPEGKVVGKAVGTRDWNSPEAVNSIEEIFKTS